MVWKSRTCRVLAALAGCSLSGAALAQSQNFDSTAVGSLPSGWATISTGIGAPWAVVSDQSHSAPNAVFSNDPGDVSTQYLTLPSIQAAGTVRLDFWKRFITENTYDGLTVEVDINGAGFNNVGTAAFSVGPYNQAAISGCCGSPIAGQPAFSGGGGAWSESVVLISANVGDVVTFRFNMSSDESVNSTGAWIDDVSVTTSSNFGACCDSLQGTCSLNTAALCTGAGVTFQGAGSACPSICPPQGACCDAASGACTLVGAAGCTSPRTFQGGGSVCVPYPCPAPANDNCSDVLANNAPRIPGAGGTVLGNNFGATDDGQGLCTTGHKDIYWLFTPATTNAWTFQTCNTSPGFDTTISIHTGCPADTSTQVAGGCNDDSCGALSNVTVAGLTAGTQYIVRVGNFSTSATAGGNIVLDVIAAQLGACCNTTSGACTSSTTGAAGCGAGTTYQGDNTSCTPSPCQQEACCNAATGACTLAATGACASGTTGQGNGSTCATVTCPTQACCNPNGACTVVGTDPCPSGTTAQGAGTTCAVNPCPQPPGASCASALTINLNTPTPGNLTDNGGTSNISCSSGVRGTWYSFTAPATGSYLIDSMLTSGAGNPSIGVFTGDCSAQLACVNPCTGTDTQAVITLNQGDNIHFRAGGCGDIQLAWSVTVSTTIVGACCNASTGACVQSNSGSAGCPSGTTYQGDNSSCTPSNPCPQPPPPANDECSASVAVTIGATVTGSNVNATASGALTSTGTGSCTQASFNTGTHLDVWYRFVAPATTDYTLDTCGSAIDTVMSIHSGCPGDQSNILDCNDDANVACSNSGLNSRIDAVSLTAGQTYYISVAGYNGASGAISLTVNYVTPPTGGVCCRGATCNTTLADAASCSASLVPGQTAGALFVDSITACNNSGNNTSPCCYANYNKTGGISVQDIFDFLNDWFAGSPYANTGGSGAPGSLAVQNIFDFLNAWFAGGCS